MEADQQHIAIEQYAHYGESILAHNQRTDTANRFYLTFTVALLSAGGVAILQGIELTGGQRAWYALVGLLVSGLWFLTLLSHRRFNIAKHETIQALEEKLGLPFDAYRREKARLDEFKTYWPIGRLMMFVPGLFAVAFLVLSFAFLD